jgi:hypothetical protein
VVLLLVLMYSNVVVLPFYLEVSILGEHQYNQYLSSFILPS